ncbi:regulator of G-protein signaling 10 isoform X1 [Mixophyes fleayi]|uniref:regulator of G-protein signaling 10 isoform X1 n=1 Tax=Mixophyes fleayi TaxID=3061075 RepID=UPI003F4DF29E
MFTRAVSRLSRKRPPSEYHGNDGLNIQDQNLKGTQKWATSLDNLLEDPEGVAEFTDFLKKEFSEENLLFWLACEDFKKTEDQEQTTSLKLHLLRICLCGSVALQVVSSKLLVLIYSCWLNCSYFIYAYNGITGYLTLAASPVTTFLPGLLLVPPMLCCLTVVPYTCCITISTLLLDCSCYWYI